MTDPVKALALKLRRCCGPLATPRIAHDESRAWQSLLFDGARHHLRLVMAANGADRTADALRRALACPHFTIAGHIIADSRLSDPRREGQEAIICLDLLTIKAPDEGSGRASASPCCAEGPASHGAAGRAAPPSATHGGPVPEPEPRAKPPRPAAGGQG